MIVRSAVAFVFALASLLPLGPLAFAQQVDEIVVLSSIPPNSGQAAFWVEVGKLYERFNPGVRIRWDFSASWGDYIQKLNVSLAARRGPDIAWGNTDYLNVPGRGLENQADVIPVPDEFFTPDEVAAMSEAVLMQTVYPGKGRIIWPWSIYVGEIGTFLVNAEYLRGVGYDPAEIRRNGWTTDEYVDAMTKIKEKYGADAFYLLPADGEYASSVVYNSKIRPLYQMGLEGMFGNPIFDLVTGEIILDEALLARSWGWVADLIDRGLVQPFTRGFQEGDKQNAFLTGRIATWWNGPDRLVLIRR
ncbi:MAG TPA: ABC transporter substrate-binding protein, partial [Limnochordia bacterium]